MTAGYLGGWGRKSDYGTGKYNRERACPKYGRLHIEYAMKANKIGIGSGSCGWTG